MIKKSKAFTLIEMMLVVVVLGAVIIYATNFERKKSQQFSVNKTANDMQNILIAAAAYYVLEGDVWPTDISNDLVAKGYLLDGLQCSPWNTTTSSSDCKNKAKYSICLPLNNGVMDDTAPLFTLVLPVKNLKLATLIADVLPTTYAASSNPSCGSGAMVLASTPIPGRAEPPMDGLLLKVIKNQYYQYSNSDTDYQPLNPNSQEIHCPPGWSKNFRAALSYNLNCKSASGTCHSLSAGSTEAAREFYINVPQIQMSRSNPPGPDNTWHENFSNWGAAITVNTDYPYGGDIHEGNAMVVEYCIPPGYSDTSALY